ncbi:MAG: hypothetical protein ACOYN4_13085 [Bacteroidales bacterium]
MISSTLRVDKKTLEGLDWGRLNPNISEDMMRPKRTERFMGELGTVD